MKKTTAASLVLAMTLATGGCTAPPAPGERITMIQASGLVRTLWPVDEAVTFWSGYTSSTERFGPCRPGAKCIVVEQVIDQTLCGSGAIGCTTGIIGPWAPTVIRIQLKASLTPGILRSRTTTHEFGHAHGIIEHNENCDFIMFRSVNCPGSGIAGTQVSDEEIQIVRTN